MTTVETRVVDPVPRRASVNEVEVSETEMVDKALVQAEEEQMLHDEEVDSCEAEDLEDRILTVALVKSVIDTRAQAPKDQPSPRYSLRKRKRALPRDDEAEGDSKPASEPVSSGGPTATITNGRLSLIGPTVTIETGEQSVKPQASDGRGTGTNEPSRSKEKGNRVVPESSGTKAAASTGESSVATVGGLIAPRGEVSMESGGPQLEQVTITPCIAGAPVSACSTVARPDETPAGFPSEKPDATVGSAVSSTPNRPYPPAAVTAPPTGESSAGAQSVPCLQPECTEMPLEKRVTIAEPPVGPSRSRIFSVDLDPSSFDFSDMAGDHMDMGKGEGDIGDLVGPPAPGDDLTIFKRDRAFSFEFFSFAGDDLLPASLAPAPGPSADLPDPTVLPDENVSQRPRGESLIFDPVSFQEGGIHEKNAIMVNTVEKRPTKIASDAKIAPPSSSQVRSQPIPRAETAVNPSSIPIPEETVSVPPASTSNSVADNEMVATLPSSLAVGNSNGNTPATFQMELLNKDGRIGIYLPEARRARIARFHAKRKMRIWRKRIKYDCRKKLADSRPRIKGRFVKRSDMDEEE